MITLVRGLGRRGVLEQFDYGLHIVPSAECIFGLKLRKMTEK